MYKSGGVATGSGFVPARRCAVAVEAQNNGVGESAAICHMELL